MGKREELYEKVIYVLDGENVANVLEQMGREDLLEDIDKFEDIVNYLNYDLNMPAEEYIRYNIENYLDNLE